ncbi:hypothetical protein AB6D11_00480 [Vibrio splendidus]
MTDSNTLMNNKGVAVPPRPDLSPTYLLPSFIQWCSNSEQQCVRNDMDDIEFFLESIIKADPDLTDDAYCLSKELEFSVWDIDYQTCHALNEWQSIMKDLWNEEQAKWIETYKPVCPVKIGESIHGWTVVSMSSILPAHAECIESGQSVSDSEGWRHHIPFESLINTSNDNK